MNTEGQSGYIIFLRKQKNWTTFSIQRSSRIIDGSMNFQSDPMYLDQETEYFSGQEASP